MLAHADGGSSFRDVTASSVSRWERDLDVRDRRIFKRIAGPLLIEFGYAKDDAW